MTITGEKASHLPTPVPAPDVEKLLWWNTFSCDFICKFIEPSRKTLCMVINYIFFLYLPYWQNYHFWPQTIKKSNRKSVTVSRLGHGDPNERPFFLKGNPVSVSGTPFPVWGSWFPKRETWFELDHFLENWVLISGNRDPFFISNLESCYLGISL